MFIIETFRQQFTEQYELLIRLIIAGILGMAIGFERKNRSKMAGVRTHAIVAVGSALIMIVSKYGFNDMASFDGSRIAAQIVSGIGFLGAGIIVVKDNMSVSGLTTAAGIWTTAGVGMCIGAGQYFLAVSSGMLLVILQELLHRIGFLSGEAYRANIKIVVNQSVDIHQLESYILKEKVRIASIKMSRKDEQFTKIEMELVFLPKQDKMDFLNHLAVYPGIMSVRG